MVGVEGRLARLEATKKIEALSTRYCLAVDCRNLEAVIDIFCHDAELVIPAFDATVHGHDAIREVFRAEFEALGRTFHWTHDRMIDVDDSNALDTARGLVLAHAEVVLDGKTNVAAMRYDDEYRQERGTWRISRRRIGFTYYVPMNDYPAHFMQDARIFRGGIWLPGEDAKLAD